MNSTESARRAITAPFRVQTYKNLAYLALAFPLGLAYFVGFTVGVSLGLGLAITVIGVPILLVTVAAATFAAGFEAYLANRFTGVDASVPSFLSEFGLREGFALPGDGFVDSVKRLVTAPSTWTSFFLVLTKFVFGLVSFVALVVTGSVAAVMLSAPFVYDDPSVTYGFAGEAVLGGYRVGSFVIDTLPEAVAVAFGGVVFLTVALNVLNGFASFQARYTAALLQTD